MIGHVLTTICGGVSCSACSAVVTGTSTLCWLGFTDNATEGSWLWDGDSTATWTAANNGGIYTNWYPTEPTGVNGGDCTSIGRTGFNEMWNDWHCGQTSRPNLDQELSCLCSFSQTNSPTSSPTLIPTTSAPSISPHPTPYVSSYVKMPSSAGSTWAQCQASCAALAASGLAIARIDSDADNAAAFR